MNSMRIMLLVAASLFSCGTFASDLQSRSIVLSPYAEANMYTAGDHVSARWECVNSGADIPETFYIAIYVDGRLVDRESKSGLKRDEVISGSYSLGELTVGSHSFTVVFDSENAIEETSEGNNVSSAMISVKDPEDPQSGSGGSSGNPYNPGDPDNPGDPYNPGDPDNSEDGDYEFISIDGGRKWEYSIDGAYACLSYVDDDGDITIPTVIYVISPDDEAYWPGWEYPAYESHPILIFRWFNWSLSKLEYLCERYAECSAYLVRSISGFRQHRGIVSVIIPDSVTSIVGDAFSGCSSMTSVTIGNAVTNIGEGAFSCCSSLTNVTIPDSVTNIGEGAFSGCSSLTNVTIPDSVTSIGGGAFSGCSGLMSFTVDASNPIYSSTNGLLLSKDGRTLIKGVNGDVTIPDSVTNIAVSAFDGFRGLTSVTISSNVTSIGRWAFSGCSGLRSVVIPDSVTRIGEWAFEDCSGLTRVTIPSYVIMPWNYYVFPGCSKLVSIDVNTHNPFYSSVNGLLLSKDGRTLMQGVNGDVKIPDGVTCISDSAFANCSGLTSVMIPSSVTSIEGGAFSDCSELTSVTMSGDCPSVASSAFSGVAPNCVVHLPAGNYTYEVDDDEKWQGMRVGWYGDVGLAVVTFDACGGVASLEEKKVVVGNQIRVLPIATWTGYDFLGWFTTADGGVQVASSYLVDENMTLYAHWRKIEARMPTRFSGDADWTQESNGLWRSGHVEDWGRTAAIMDVAGPCIISFKWKTSSEIHYDGLHFYIDGEEYEYWISGEWGDEWDSVNVEVSTVGVVELKWEYAKDVSDSGGEDCGWIKDIDWTQIGLIPTINGDDGATVEGDAESGYTIKPSAGKKDVAVTIPDGVVADKVTVEIGTDVQTVRANGANVKVVKDGHDITEHLDIPSSIDGVVAVGSATVKESVVKETLDVAKGAVIDITPASPTLTTAETKPGLTYTLREGATLGGMVDGDSKVGDGAKWTPNITVKGGASGFYTIKVEK